jgi:hypothetical protein
VVMTVVDRMAGMAARVEEVGPLEVAVVMAVAMAVMAIDETTGPGGSGRRQD